MKSVWIVFTLAMMFLVPAGLSGCGTKEKATDKTAVGTEKKAAAPADKPAAEKPAAEHPATDKPKDHPAH
jgi:hypothetical protein